MSFTNNVEILGEPGVARQLTAGSTSAATQLSANVHRISMRAVGADIRFLIQPSTATDVDQVNAVFAENYKQSAGRIRPQANKLFRHVVQVEDLIDQGSALGLDFGEMLLKLQQT